MTLVRDLLFQGLLWKIDNFKNYFGGSVFFKAIAIVKCTYEVLVYIMFFFADKHMEKIQLDIPILST